MNHAAEHQQIHQHQRSMQSPDSEISGTDALTEQMVVAIHEQRTDLIHKILKVSNFVVDHPDFIGWTPLHHAVFLNNTTIVRMLLKGNASILCKNYEGYTPRHLACIRDDKEMVGLLDSYIEHNTYQEKDSVDVFHGRYHAHIAPETFYEKCWAHVQRLTKWNILSYFAQIALCIVLEIFFDQLKSALQIAVVLAPQYIQHLQILIPLIKYIFSPFLKIFIPFQNIVPIILKVYGSLVKSPFSLFFRVFKKLFGSLVSKMFNHIIIIFKPIWVVLFKPFGEYFVWLILQPFQLLGYIFMPIFIQIRDKYKAEVWAKLTKFFTLKKLLSKTFNPLIKILQETLTFILPESVLDPIRNLSLKLFKIETNRNNTEGTALLVLLGLTFLIMIITVFIFVLIQIQPLVYHIVSKLIVTIFHQRIKTAYIVVLESYANAITNCMLICFGISVAVTYMTYD
eukprot:TRINITY_DN1124_c0_g1_i1.p1 TRINITY_DN1124_c0_g1~~TRINITY_DN1124_c0_g1_i1.p1  ORF type:complete len:454 (-),score=51.46 TRINITY_DN1124_c0_g1_i1:77-1438(-)